ncbi:unnamed protein product [Hermetia illucens]|uniref:Uncharacterized protein n=1 Tax=Hermetia illucens TaxID=343691 RepID=A0A7R8UZ85_HERIL|nr:unnamed protein product [Hermetia illucens]
MKILSAFLLALLLQILAVVTSNVGEERTPTVFGHPKPSEVKTLATEEQIILSNDGDGNQKFICTKANCCSRCRKIGHKCGYCKNVLQCVCLK